MNDDQIRSELERRAGSAPSAPDWTKRTLLPAVWHEIDARPAPVIISRWPSLAGATALVVALLILVVAIPRLTPHPPTSTGSAGTSPSSSPDSSPDTMSPTEFFEGWRSGDLKGQTVLVDGSIEPGFTTANARPPCLPPSPCTWGTLTGINPLLSVYARDFAVPEDAGGTLREGEDWPWWSSPTVPVSGTFVLSVQDDGLVVFGGLVRPSQGGIEWSLADVAAVDPATVRPDEGLLVRGQLVTVGIDRDCRTVPPPPAGLPNRVRACQSTSVIVDGDPGDAGTVYVQRDAAAQFGSTEAVYAISPRLYGGYCGDEPPCWLWDVVARVDAAPTPEPTPVTTPEIAPSPTPDGSPSSARPIPCEAAPHASLYPTVTDETGLVAGCTAARTNLTEFFPLSVTNPGGDLTMLEIAWAGATCDGPDRLYLRRTGSAFALAAESDKPLNVLCDSTTYENHMRLTLTEPIDATQVTTSLEFAPPTSPAPSVESNTLACDSSAPGGDHGVGLTDHAGLIESCSIQMVDWPGQPIVVSDVERGVVRVVHSDGCAGATEAELDLWARGDLEWPGQPRYVLNVALQAPQPPRGCRNLMVGIAVDITFINADLAPVALASEVEALVTVDGLGTAVTETEDGSHRFTLEIAADKPEYIEGDAIGVSSSLTSDAEVTLSCHGQHIALGQLDGPLEFYPGPFILMCPGPTELRAGEPIIRAFAPIWGSTEPNPLAPYLRGDALFLPAGTYRFFVSSSFTLGEIGDDQVRLEASVIVRVKPALSAAPESSPSTAVDCSPTFLLLDETGLVEACSTWTPERANLE